MTYFLLYQYMYCYHFASRPPNASPPHHKSKLSISLVIKIHNEDKTFNFFLDSAPDTWWSDPDLKVKWIDASTAGVWAIKLDQTVSFFQRPQYAITLVLQVLYREGTGYGVFGSGSGWTAVTGGKMRMLSVGGEVSKVFILLKIATNFPGCVGHQSC